VLVELGDFDDELVTVLFRPTETALREALAAHAAIAEEYPDDLFLFYYSGHADAQGLRLGDERYWFDALKHDFRAVESDVRVGVLDACRSGTITRFKGAAVTESIFGVEGTIAEGEAWLTASAPDELAQESESLRGGFFTHYLLSGMRGAADTDDGVVALDELYRYTFDRVVEVTGRTGIGTQHPYYENDLQGAGSFGLTDVRKASATLILQSEDGGEVAVFRLPDKTQLAEFVKAPGRETTIAVSPGRYLVRRRYNDATYEATFGIHEGAQIRVQGWGNAIMEGGIARGDPRAADLVAESEDYERRMNLGNSPGVAGGASLLVPGAGQIYNGEILKGIAYFTVTGALVAGLVFQPESEDIHPGLWPMVGAAVWGASVADAAYRVHQREDTRPRLGVQVSGGLAYGGGDFPQHAGLSADLMLRRGISIGLDRVGYTPQPDGGWDLAAGSRVILAAEGEKFRPGLLVGLGVRHGRAYDEAVEPTLSTATLPPPTGEVPIEEPVTQTRTTFSIGTQLRYYVVPRYFLEADLRYENTGDWAGGTASLGFGVHLGR
jgi:hypothetical protein